MSAATTAACVLHPGHAASYAPANHVGTRNRRVVGPETVGARHMEVLVGTIAPGGRGLAHAHPGLEQAGIVLAGRAVSVLGTVTRELRAGDVDFIPKDVFHSAHVVSEEPLELVVIYAPPYLENPEARVLQPGPTLASEAPAAVTLPSVGARDGLVGKPAEILPVLDAQRTGARHLRIDHVRVGAAGVFELPAQEGAERLLMLRDGSVSGSTAGTRIVAHASDWVFIPDGGACTFRAAAAGLDAILVTARSEPARAG